MDFKRTISALPLTSGVYLMKDAQGKMLYIGKAVCLRKRVQSHFRHRGTSAKTDVLTAGVCEIDYRETNSAAEALILEASLIKEHHPKFNIELRDDKSYPYIEITKEKFPRILVSRPALTNKVLPKTSHFYGPYVNAKLTREALAIIRKIFHFRTCEPLPDKACLDYHLGLCDAPCIENIDEKTYAKIIRNVRLILEGKRDELYKSLQKDMEAFARDKQFEQAAKVRDQLRAIGALYSGTKDINYFKEAEQLQRALALPKLPERIECFDISNIHGQQSVGSMVSFWNGKPDKGNYRRFRIRRVEGIDDFGMIAEVVSRRYRRLKEERAIFPDLIIIDGGKGQLRAAMQELAKLEIEIPLMALAKQQEEIFLPGRRFSVILPPDSLGLKLIQRIRDEAHRFALSYHRLLRGKNALGKDLTAAN